MKKMLTVFLFLVFTGLAFSFNIANAAKPVITSDKQYFDVSRGLYFLTGNVYVATSNRVITADEATVDPTGLQVWAKGHITLKQDDITFTGDVLHVVGSKTLAKVTGNLYFARSNFAISSNYGEYNWKTKIASFKDDVIVKNANGEEERFQSLKYNVVDDEIVESEK